MKTYKQLKKELANMTAERHRCEQANDNFHRSGDYDSMMRSFAELNREIDDVTINMDGKTDAEILVEFLKVAETATSHEDFVDSGVIFPSRCCDKPGHKINYGLVTWVANLLKCNSAAILDDVQRAIDVYFKHINDEFEAYTITHHREHIPHCTIWANGDSYEFEANKPAIAITATLLKVIIANPQPEVFKLPGT